MRLAQNGRKAFAAGIFLLGVTVLLFTRWKFWPWILLVLALTQTPMLYRHGRWHSQLFMMSLWLTVFPFILHFEALYPEARILRWGIIGLMVLTVLYIGVASLFKFRHSCSHSRQSRRRHHSKRYHLKGGFPDVNGPEGEASRTHHRKHSSIYQ